MVIEQIAQKVMSKLGVYDKGNPVDAEDLQNVVDAYQAVYYTLSDDGLVTWGIADEDIPIRFSLSLIILIAAEIADFYPQNPPAEGWANAKLQAKNTIRRQLASGQPTDVVTAEYF